MKIQMKKTLSVLLSIVMLASVFAGMTFTASAASSGTCGDNLTWTLDDDGLLTISGTGPMTDYDSLSPSPFYSSTAIKTVVIGSGVTSIGDRAFWYCSHMTSADIPDSVTWIGEYAFEGCSGLTYVDLPDRMRTFGFYAFEGCTGLKSVELPSGLRDIPNYSFWGCSGLQTMIIPDNVISIGIEAFHGCSSLTAMVLPSGVDDIAGNAFYGCINLTTLTLPSGVTRIGRSAFYGCNSLTDVYYAGIAAQWNNIEIMTGNEKLTGSNIHYSSILFGSYPQTKVTDDTLIAALDAADKVWASYDYYSGNGEYDGLMQPGDWMQFADFFCGGEKYRAVKFTAYRPYDTFLMLNEGYTYQADNGYTTNVVYYFRYEPLIWRVLDPSAGYIMCESLIDSQAYQNTVYSEDDQTFYQAIGSSVYANDYAASSIRGWLNLDFFETAFTAAQKENIKTTALDNCADEATTYDYAGTNDKIFLLSYADANNGDYGFSSDADRIAQGTDYAKCQGLYCDEGDSFWRLRSPTIFSSNSHAVYRNGFVGERKVFITCYGVRPACVLSGLSSDITVSGTLYSCARAGHIPAEAVAENNVAPTCGAAGSYDSVVYCANCGAEVSRETVTVSATGVHTYGDPVWSWAKCHGKATATFTCTGCGGEAQTVTDNAPTFANGQFTATVEFDGTPYTDTVSLGTGDLVEFGSYPQSLVTDQTLKAELNSLAESWTDSDWTYYDYYVGNAQEDFMKYADVTYNGNQYRAVTFSHYRTRNTTDASTDADYTWQDENGYSPDTIYWFEYEPIVWRILDADAGLMMTESIIDSQPFNNGFYQSGREYYVDADHTHYASDWAYSSLRAWMNGDFLNAAFDSGDQNHIKNTSLVTPSSRNPDYDAGPTTDKIFLLSRDDAMNTAYGFISGTDGNESANRTAFGTDYAKCQGLWVDSTAGAYYSGASHWSLRSPVYDYGTSYVSNEGFVNTNNPTNRACRGVRAALNIDIQSAISQSAVRIYHDYGELIPEVPATCADDGTIAHYVCSLCGRYLDADKNPVADLSIPAAGHTYGDTGDDRFTCTVCGEVDNDLKAAAELAAAKETLSDAIGTAREYYESIKDDYPVIADDLDTKLQQAEGVLGNDAATINEVNSMIELAGTALDAAKDARKAADMAAFADYKETVKGLADGMKNEGDSDACIALIEAAKEAVDAVTYDESKTLDENKDAVDDAAALTQLAAALAEQRAAEANDPKEAFEEYRATLLTLAEALRRDGDSEAVTALIDEAVAALTGYVYDEAKTLDENEEALSDLLSAYADAVRSQRHAERQEVLNHMPCSLCGQHHTGSLMDNMIGIVHGLIWIMQCFLTIAV